MKIKRGDTVKVIAGDDKGATGVVIQVLPKEDRVIVQGVNIVKKHRKPTQANPDGAIEEKESPAEVDNKIAELLKKEFIAKANKQ